MVKLGGPALSLDASGTIGNLLTFAKWKGRPYVRTRVIPTNPKSAAQLGMRAMLKFLSQNWADIAASPQASWDDAADAKKISAFNAFSATNLSNWRDFLAPGQDASLLRTGTVSTITATTASAAGRYASSIVDLGVAADQWGLVVFMSATTGFTPNWNNARLVVIAPEDGNTVINIGPLATGTYYLRYATFGEAGKWGPAYATQDSVVIA